MRYVSQKIVKSLFSKMGLDIRYKFQNPPIWHPGIYPEIPERCIIFDVGANIGQSTMQFAKHFSKAEIHAFEPFPKAYQALVDNTRALNCLANNVALSNVQGEIYVPKPFNATSPINTVNDCLTEQSPESLTIELNTLDGYCDKAQVDCIHIIKIDTEGHDLKVIQGGKNLLSHGRVRYVMVEVGFQHDTHYGPFDDIYAQLRDYGLVLSGFYEPTNLRSGRSDFSNALFELLA